MPRDWAAGPHSIHFDLAVVPPNPPRTRSDAFFRLTDRSRTFPADFFCLAFLLPAMSDLLLFGAGGNARALARNEVTDAQDRRHRNNGTDSSQLIPEIAWVASANGVKPLERR